ncbi:type-F conjugative transfer system secretin TraK [Neiella marina]|uniref:Type-F conjugative transfer system secretin TraK n=1 Tax=Neiella holothuriorum TaxID=2870530 RepID=A0ABS7EGA0_9GAMM|nr:type-F conjugative transfer system secretin TraK [Neiella holothuriorum]MBW8191374.1 type-F conjugative transfer system secretin TraK [Neiella holothuriorum]
MNRIVWQALCAGVISTLSTATLANEPQQPEFKLPVVMTSPDTMGQPPAPRSREELLASQGVGSNRVQGGYVIEVPQQESGGVDPAEALMTLVESQKKGKQPNAEVSRLTGQPRAMDSQMMSKIKDTYRSVQRLTIAPGESKLVPVAQGLMNRIETPFKMVAVKDSGAEDVIVDLDGGMVFVTINSYEPMSLMVYEEGVPETMFSIMLQPIEAPPVMIDVDMDISPAMIAKGEAFRRQLEIDEKLAQADRMQDMQTKTSEHVRRIKEILAPVARGEVPRGFSFTDEIPTHYREPCSITIYQEAKQRLIGAREVVDVVLVENTSSQAYYVREQHCLMKDTIAAAVLDRSLLMPGERTEVYILRDKLYEQRKARVKRRPRLID